MAIRNCREIGENLQLIMKRLIANDDLVKYLYYTDKDPLSHANLTDEQKRNEVFNKLVRILPRVLPNDIAQPIIAIQVTHGSRMSDNDQFRNVQLVIDVFVPLDQWFIKETNLRPFAILGEIQESLDEKKINGLGKLSGGDFEVKLVTEEFSCYEASYSLITYD